MPESEACNFIKKETLAQVFSWEFCEISKNTFFIEHLRVNAFEVSHNQNQNQNQNQVINERNSIFRFTHSSVL